MGRKSPPWYNKARQSPGVGSLHSQGLSAMVICELSPEPGEAKNVTSGSVYSFGGFWAEPTHAHYVCDLKGMHEQEKQRLFCRLVGFFVST